MDAKEDFDFELSDGTKGKIDKSRVTLREWRDFWNFLTPDEQNDKLLQRTTGLKLEYIQGLLLDDYRRLTEAFRIKCLSPLSDPKKSESASTPP